MGLGRRQKGGQGGTGGAVASSGNVSPKSWNNFVSVGEFSTENCVLTHRKLPYILLFSPLSENPAPRLANPGATPVLDLNHCN